MLDKLNRGHMSEPVVPDPKTKELYELLNLTDPSKREEFIRMASIRPTNLTAELPAHFRLDSLTSSSGGESDAELA